MEKTLRMAIGFPLIVIGFGLFLDGLIMMISRNGPWNGKITLGALILILGLVLLIYYRKRK